MQSAHNQIKLIALDLDGTTLNSQGNISTFTRDTLLKLQDYGVHIVISTGRSFNSLPDSIKTISSIEYAITSNGAHINMLSTGKSIYEDYLNLSTVNDVDRLSKMVNTEIEVFVGGQAYIDKRYYEFIRKNGSEFRNAEYVLWSRKPIENINNFLLDRKDEIENVNFCFYSIEEKEKVRPILEKIHDATITSSFKNNIEVGGKNTSKKTALTVILKKLGLTRENLMAFGDAPNDIKMLEYAKIGVAVANAWGDTAKHADYITLSNDEDGVAHAINKLIFQKCCQK